MASSKLPWSRLWTTLWFLIPKPTTKGRLLLALDDYINPKTGKKIFGGASFFDHAAKTNQLKYPWSQNVVSIGLLKIVKGRWACLPLAFHFYHIKKRLRPRRLGLMARYHHFKPNLSRPFEMLPEISAAFSGIPLLIVTDSWFGNDDLLKPMRKTIGQHCHMLSRLRVNTTLFALPPEHRKHQLGRSRKYGDKMGNATTLANESHERTTTYSVNLYGKQRDVLAFDNIMMLKTLKCAVRIVWIYRRSQWIALFTTNLDLTVEQTNEYYGARCKIEAGFKEIKQEIGSSKSQIRNYHAVTNYLTLRMMAATVTWIYADHLLATNRNVRFCSK